jgi:hypothetical protein
VNLGQQPTQFGDLGRRKVGQQGIVGLLDLHPQSGELFLAGFGQVDAEAAAVGRVGGGSLSPRQPVATKPRKRRSMVWPRPRTPCSGAWSVPAYWASAGPS